MIVRASAMSQAEAAHEEILCLDQADLWTNAGFQQRLLHSLSREGFGDEAIEATRRVFARSDPPDFDAFVTAANSSPDRALVSPVVDHWRAVRAKNLSIYRPASPDDHKMRFWPNNPKTLQSNWESYADILEVDLFATQHRFITPETPIASAGSCFAGNISRQLQHWNYNYVLEMGLSKEHHSDPANYASDPACCGNIYNAVSMRMMIERAFGEWIPDKILMTAAPRVLDPYRSAGDVATVDEYLERWHEHSAALNRALTKCRVFILTLGMTEIWRFADSDLSTGVAPGRGDPTLFRHHNLSVEENVEELERIHTLFRKHNPECRIITTVSPVPLNATFNADTSVVVANALSKSVLRVALDIFSKSHPDNVFYFPSYEAVTMGCANPWQFDKRHVSNDAVRRVMRQFQRMFLVDQSPLEIVGIAEVDSVITPKRQPIRRFVRERLVHPLKRRLGIEGKPFRSAINGS